MVNSEKLIGTKEYLTLYAGCGIKRFRYKRVVSFYVKQWGINWYHKISDVICGVWHKPISLQTSSFILC